MDGERRLATKGERGRDCTFETLVGLLAIVQSRGQAMNA